MPRKKKLEKVEMRVNNFGVDAITGDPVIVLKVINKDIFIPMLIGPFESVSIALAIEKMKYPRPLAHDFLVSVIKALGAKLVEVVITEIKNEVFIATAVFKKGKKILEIDCRPSDGIATALRVEGCKIFATQSVLETE